MPILQVQAVPVPYRCAMSAAPDITYQVSDTMPAPASEPPSMPVPFEEWSELYQNFRTLGPTARQVLLMTAKRLAMGRKQYNDDFDADRDMAHEALEEAADLAVYCQVGLIKARRK